MSCLKHYSGGREASRTILRGMTEDRASHFTREANQMSIAQHTLICWLSVYGFSREYSSSEKGGKPQRQM